MSKVTLLTRKAVVKPWGRADLPPPFDVAGSGTVGEIWFESDGDPLDLLVKYLFTSQKLSIQVHPCDGLAHAKGLQSGKEECWLVLDAEPGAKLGIGTRKKLEPEELRAAALDGSLASLIDWRPVSRGDFYYIPAGTVHAIGAGVTLVEVQQNADITYRLFDYGRPRELHLDNGVEAATAEPYDQGLFSKIDFDQQSHIVKGPKFDLWFTSKWPLDGLSNEPVQIIPLLGDVLAGETKASAGDCMLCHPDVPLVTTSDFRALVAQPSPQGLWK